VTAFEAQTIDRSKLYTSIVDQIIEGIRSGTLPPGSALPAERVLAQQLGVSRGSVREAVRVLEHAGIITVRPGSGTFVTETSLSSGMVLRAHAAAAGENSPLDTIVVRRMLEPDTAALAARERSSADLATLERLVEEQAVLVADGSNPSEPDIAFHIALAAATHNPVVEMIARQMLAITKQSIWSMLKAASIDRVGKAELFLAQHRAILEAVQGQDADAARLRMDEHLASVEAGLIDEVGAT
jgi:GntR family transcriptional repressor for pyruvate dehydrogenase complex